MGAWAAGWLVASHAAPDRPASVHIAQCPKDISGPWQWQQLQLGADALPGLVQATLDAMSFRTLQVHPGVRASLTQDSRQGGHATG